MSQKKLLSMTCWMKIVRNAFLVKCFRKCIRKVSIIAIEASAILKHVIPATVTWYIRKYFMNQIQTIPLQVKVGEATKLAYLHIHTNNILIQKGENISPILLTHGDFSHPYTMLPLADIAQKEGFLTFSLHLPGELHGQHYHLSQEILQKAIDHIEDLIVSKEGIFAGLLGTGHSSGGILLSDRQFVALDKRVKATCAIASRLNISDERECHDGILKTGIKAIYNGIVNYPELPLMQIIPRDDWNAPQQSMAVRLGLHQYSVPGMHLSGLYTCETRKYFTRFIKEFS